MSRAQSHLAHANRHIAELTVQIIRQRVIIKYALDTGQRSEMAESLLDALEGSLRLFERHPIFLLSCSVNRPSKGDHPSAPTRRIPIGAPNQGRRHVQSSVALAAATRKPTAVYQFLLEGTAR